MGLPQDDNIIMQQQLVYSTKCTSATNSISERPQNTAPQFTLALLWPQAAAEKLCKLY